VVIFFSKERASHYPALHLSAFKEPVVIFFSKDNL
jgi:hypothetical protein